MDRHTGAKWLIHGPKHPKDNHNQPQKAWNIPAEYPNISWECRHDTSEFHRWSKDRDIGRCVIAETLVWYTHSVLFLYHLFSDVATIHTIDTTMEETSSPMTSQTRHYNAMVTITSYQENTSTQAPPRNTTFYFHHEVYALPITITLAICMTMISVLLVLIAILVIYARFRGWKRHRHVNPGPAVHITDKLGCSLRGGRIWTGLIRWVEG